MAKGCEGVVKILDGGNEIDISDLTEFGISGAAETESIPILNSGCVNKAQTSSKELTVNIGGCWDCMDLGQSFIKCDSSPRFVWYPKGENPTFEDPNNPGTQIPIPAGSIPRWEGNISISSYDMSSNAADAILAFTASGTVDGSNPVVSQNMPY